MNRITSIIFTIFLNLWGAIIPIIYFPAFIFRSAKIADHGAKIWAIGVMWMLKKLCQIDYEFIGLENLPKEPFIIACKHQSAWETIIMHLIVNRPAYAFKKELLKIPFYGWYLRVMSGIIVDRSGGASALKALIKQTKNYLAKGQSIVLFPQGTRVPVRVESDKFPYQAGIAALYLSTGAKVVPAALNSGIFWGRETPKKPGRITLEFLEPINPGLSKQEFMAKLETVIEKKSNELVEKTK
jgi:1-acyl-sn-glycerol-3-phosphate acyltransferase